MKKHMRVLTVEHDLVLNGIRWYIKLIRFQFIMGLISDVLFAAKRICAVLFMMKGRAYKKERKSVPFCFVKQFEPTLTNANPRVIMRL